MKRQSLKQIENVIFEMLRVTDAWSHLRQSRGYFPDGMTSRLSRPRRRDPTQPRVLCGSGTRGKDTGTIFCKQIIKKSEVILL
jgi:hypothetical protein